MNSEDGRGVWLLEDEVRGDDVSVRRAEQHKKALHALLYTPLRHIPTIRASEAQEG